LQEQFDLAMKIRDRVTDADEAVVNVRKVRDQINDRLEKSKFIERDSARKPMTSALENLNGKLTAVEEAIYQVKNRSGQDPLNFPIKLNNKIAHLMPVIEAGADAAPTDQDYAAFDQLSKELDAELLKLHDAIQNDLPAFNRLLAGSTMPPVTVSATTSSSSSEQ